MTEKIGFPDYILDPVELDKDYEGVGDHFIFYIPKYISLCKTCIDFQIITRLCMRFVPIFSV